MGKRGPKPTPLTILRLRGSWRGNAKPPAQSKGGRPAARAPKCPGGMDPVAAGEWRRVVGELESLGLVCELDRSALESYSVYYALWQRLLKALKRRRIGSNAHSRVFGQALKANAQMLRAAACFGMSPADRARVPAAAPPAADPMDEFLKYGKTKKIQAAG